MKKKKLKNQKYILEFGYSRLADQISHDTVVSRVKLEHVGGCSEEEREIFDKAIKMVIRNYRGSNVLDEDGIWGIQYNDLLPKGMYGFWVKIYRENEDGTYSEASPIYCSDKGKDIVFPGADIRRAIGDILRFVYQLPDDCVKINSMEINGEIYKNIDGIYGELKSKHIVFQADMGDDRVTMYFPFRRSEDFEDLNISRISTEGFYLLEKESKNGDKLLSLSPAGHCIVSESSGGICRIPKTFRPRQVDLFYGGVKTEKGLIKGLFYYRNGELVCKYGVDQTGKTYYLSDVRAYFYNREIKDYEFRDGDKMISLIPKLKADDNETIHLNKKWVLPFLSKDSRKDDLFEETAEKFQELFEENIVDALKYPDRIRWDDGRIFERCRSCEKAGKAEKMYRSKVGKYIYCCIVMKEKYHGDKSGSDYWSGEWDTVNEIEIKKDNTRLIITLQGKSDEWIITYHDGNNGKEFKNHYRMLTGRNIRLPKMDGELKNLVSFIEKNESLLYDFLHQVEELSMDDKIYDELKKKSLLQVDMACAEIEKILYQKPLVPDKAVVNLVYEIRQYYEQSRKEKESVKSLISNVAFLGGPGTGKTTLVKRIAEYFKRIGGCEGVIIKSPSDLKGAYLGQTGMRVYNMLVEAAEKNQIIYIDEAYDLLEDKYGREALDMLLPLMTGDRTEIEKITKDIATGATNDKAEVYSFKEHGQRIPPIWLGGYEHQLRKMLSKNPGLYRRMTLISLSSPNVSGLYEHLMNMIDEEDAELPWLKKIMQSCEGDIKNYFGWATDKEYADYFANYAGVESFFRTCMVRLDEEMSDLRMKKCIQEIIDEKKKEIKKQHKAILTDVEKIKFDIQNDIETTLDDVKADEKITNKIREIVSMLVKSNEYLEKGVAIPKGVLMVGPPGTGKTLVARATAGEVQKSYENSHNKDVRVGFIATVATELNNTDKIKALFAEAEEYDTCIIFIDEIDAIGSRRNALGLPAPLFQLMKEMDGFEKRKNVFVMAATNAPEELDPALKRPGRFDRLIEVSYPEESERKEILKLYMDKLECLKGENKKAVTRLIDKIAEGTRGYTPSDLRNLVNEAGILYESCNDITMSLWKDKCPHRDGLDENSRPIERYERDILEMIERQRVGEVNRQEKDETFQVETNKGCSATAIHEVGHALVSILTGFDCFEKISVIPRGHALGYVTHNSKTVLNTKRQFLDRIKVCLGGRVAEEIFYGDDISTGAVEDIQNATRYAEDMLTLYGMSDRIGPMAAKEYKNNYLGSSRDYTCSDAFRHEIDDEIRRLLSEQMSLTRDMLVKHKELIKALAEYIFREETVTGEKFKKKYESLLKKSA